MGIRLLWVILTMLGLFSCQGSLPALVPNPQLSEEYEELVTAYGEAQPMYDFPCEHFVLQAEEAQHDYFLLRGREMYARFLIRDQRYREAFAQLQRGLNYEAVGHYPGIKAGLLVNLAYVYEAIGKKEASISLLREVIATPRASLYHQAWAHARLDLLESLSAQGEVFHFRKARSLFVKITNPGERAVISGLLANLVLKQEQPQEALSIMLQVAIDSLSPLRKTYHLNQLGHMYLSSNQLAKAEETLFTAYTHTRLLNCKELTLWTACNLGQFFMEANRYEEAVVYFSEAALIAQDFGQLKPGVEFAFTRLQEIYQSQGQYQKALEVKARFAEVSFKMARNKEILYQRLAAAQIDLLEHQDHSRSMQRETSLRYQLTIGITGLLFLLMILVLLYMFRRYKLKAAAKQELLKTGIGTAMQMLQSGKNKVLP